MFLAIYDNFAIIQKNFNFILKWWKLFSVLDGEKNSEDCEDSEESDVSDESEDSKSENSSDGSICEKIEGDQENGQRSVS